MADLEDSLTPTWANLIEGQNNLIDAVAGTITHTESGKGYKLNDRIATLIIRPRGWHLKRHLTEDAITAEICRSQVWQWLKHGAKLEDGRPIDEALVRHLIGEEMAKLKEVIGSRYSDGHSAEAVDLFPKVAISPQVIDFLTLLAYQEVTTVQRKDGQLTIP